MPPPPPLFPPGMLVKTEAEKMFMMVMPWADRNMFVALKQGSGRRRE